MKFEKYQKVRRLGTVETEGIEVGECYVFPKIDGTNASTWLDEGTIKAGSRNRELSLENDNAGFYNWLVKQGNIIQFHLNNPNLRLYGEWLCLSGDTKIKLLSGGKRGHVQTLKEMYKYATTPVKEKQHYQTKKQNKTCYTTREPWWERYGYPQIFSLYQDEDIIKPQQINKILYCGKKDVYRLTTRTGKEIKSTLEHRFWTPEGWKQLKELDECSVVGVSSLTNKREKRRYGKGTRKIYKLFKKLRKERVCEICGINNSLEVHHIDENWKNNNTKNLQVLCRECHSKQHNNITYANQSYDYMFDKIESIEYIGKEDCYDINMTHDENSASFIAQDFIVHNCPHTLRTYRDDAWRNFYVFDVYDHDNECYLHYDAYKPFLESYNINYIPPLGIVKNGTKDSFLHYLPKNNFLIEDGKGEGEGVVIKNYNFLNKFGRTEWAKIVTSKFKEKHTKEMSAPVSEIKRVESEIANSYVTEGRVNKILEKIKTERGGWRSKYIPQLLNTVYYDVITEETWNFLKEHKNPTIDFTNLKQQIIVKIKEVKSEIF